MQDLILLADLIPGCRMCCMQVTNTALPMTCHPRTTNRSRDVRAHSHVCSRLTSCGGGAVLPSVFYCSESLSCFLKLEELSIGMRGKQTSLTPVLFWPVSIKSPCSSTLGTGTKVGPDRASGKDCMEAKET